jgi:chromate transporter
MVALAAKYMRKASKSRSLKAFVGGVTASATGAVAGAAFILGRRALFDIPTVGIAVAMLVVRFKVKKLPEPVLILAAGAFGLLLERAPM